MTAIAAQVDRIRGLVSSVRETDRPAAADFGGANAMGLLVSRCEAATFHRAAGLDRSLYWPEVRDQLDAADGVLATQIWERACETGSGEELSPRV